MEFGEGETECGVGNGESRVPNQTKAIRAIRAIVAIMAIRAGKIRTGVGLAWREREDAVGEGRDFGRYHVGMVRIPRYLRTLYGENTLVARSVTGSIAASVPRGIPDIETSSFLLPSVPWMAIGSGPGIEK